MPKKKRTLRQERQSVLRPQEGSQELAMSIEADVIIYGGAAGSGKSHLLLMHPLKYVLQDPDFTGVFFRRVTRQLTGPGGLWPESGKMYRRFNVETRMTDKMHRFPQGGDLTFSHMEHPNDRFSWQGLQLSAVYFDKFCPS